MGARPTGETKGRINLIVPSIGARATFGGIQTAIDAFSAIAGASARARIISAEPIDPDVLGSFSGYRSVVAGDDSDAPREIVSIAGPDVTIPVGPDDVFIATFWTTAALAFEFRAWQALEYGNAPRRCAYLIQDYEPAFYPASAQSVLARATYDSPESTIAIFNTATLRDHFHDLGIRFTSEYTFEPRLSQALRSMSVRPPVVRARRIVAYGRPGKPRNAFPLLVDALRVWRATYQGAEQWSVVSAGEAHRAVDLGDGLVMHSVGKLDIQAYGDLLKESAIGVSLMVSPHPSYPPLEMAQLGMLVLTNRFGDKDLATWHTNITSIGSLSAVGVAADLGALCRRFELNPTVGDLGQLMRPNYLDDGPQFPFAADVATMLRGG